MAWDRLEEYGSAWAVAQALGPKLGVGLETLRKWVLQAQADAGQRGAGRDQAAEEGNAELREANDILKAASIFFAMELDPRHR